MYHLRTRMLLHEVAKNNNLTKKQVEEIVETMFEAIRSFQSDAETRETQFFPIIRVPGFCVFYPSKKYLKSWNERISKNESD